MLGCLRQQSCRHIGEKSIKDIPIATSAIQELQSQYKTALAQQINKINSDREKIKIEILSLSKDSNYFYEAVRNKQYYNTKYVTTN